MNDFSLMPSPSITPPVVLKWVGSKGTLAPHLCSLLLPLLNQGGRYFEPFMGSAAVFFYLRSVGWKGRAVLSDVLGPLVNFYRELLATPQAVFDVCAEIDARYQEAPNADAFRRGFYKAQRLFLNQNEGSSCERAGRFTWVNHRAYNGLWRTNKKGEMTTDWGGERTYLPALARMKEASRCLEGALIWDTDFATSIELATRGDVIYADPPYAQGYRYYAGSFSKDHQARLADCLRRAHQRGAQVIASNADTPEVRDLYKWASIKPISLNYSIGGAVHKTGAEVLISAVAP